MGIAVIRKSHCLDWGLLYLVWDNFLLMSVDSDAIRCAPFFIGCIDNKTITITFMKAHDWKIVFLNVKQHMEFCYVISASEEVIPQ